MKREIKRQFLSHYPKFHKVTVFFACAFLAVSCLGWQISTVPYLTGLLLLEFSDTI